MTRARQPDRTGFVERAGVRIAWEMVGRGEPAILFVPTWSVVHSRVWKLQVPDFARRHRVITFDPRGNGATDRPATDEAYAEREFAEDAVAVLDATGTERAVLVSLSLGAQRSLLVAAEHPSRVLGAVFIAPSVALGGANPARAAIPFDEDLGVDQGWARYNRHSWRRDYAGFLEFFFGECFSEPHSTKPIEDCVAWGLETDAETLIRTHVSAGIGGRDETLALASRVRCPVLVIHGDDDRIRPHRAGCELAEATGGRLLTIEGGGHIPLARDPILVNLAIRDFVVSLPGSAASPPAGGAARETRWTHALRRPRRALYISSPIGLGHAQRDVAIADELRKLHPDLEIDWLAQDPVTRVLERRGERIHPRSAELASESAHIAAEGHEHDLNAFQAIRRMDEILVLNFMVFRDAVSEGEYDLVIGDEAWDVDHFLHENPELKRTAFAWMTDFVGWLPMPEGGEREAFLTADYNAEMIEHIARYPRIRDRAIFVGSPDDIVPDDFGPGLGSIREWTEAHYAFAGYVTGFDPSPLVERREELRRELGYRPDERVVIVTVGGSGVGEALLRRVVGSFPEAARRVNGLRMIAVAGPRIEPSWLAAPPGVEVRGYVPELYKHLAACDLAVVQGGLTTTMELTAARRPFLYFPLRNHFEQNRHVRHRLERYGAGRCMDYATADPDAIAAAIAEEIDRSVDYRPVERDGAARAAALIAPLL
jgi:pimeloyl-ACP methyl ester carboxylesterase